MVDFSRVDAAAFRLFGRPATFAPRVGAQVACTVILDDGVDTANLGFSGISQNNRRLLVRLSQVADPRGGAFTVNADEYRVTGADLDVYGNVWTCSLNPTV